VSLEEYEHKRTFESTPEPVGGAGSGSLRFVVQKHQASHLHYDFRLEMGGVLKSWAVPKGPSRDPHDKRLAMMVEDHPYDYRTFEGTIPTGNYGAGTVMVWDEGTYEPLGSTGDREKDDTLAQHGVDTGHLTFILHGSKLTGEFALVKMKDADDNAWLLIKADKDSGAGQTDVTAMDRSVVSGRSMDEIAQGGDSRSELDFSDAPKAIQPASLAPMLATLASSAFDNQDWLYELKWDGYRIMAHVESGAVRLMTRGGQDYTERYEAVAKALTTLTIDCILDGELVVVDEAGKPDFGAIQDWRIGSQGTLIYYVFDVPYAGGYDMRAMTLERRKALLAQIVEPLDGVRMSDHVRGNGKALFALAQQQHLEGIMAKSAESHYHPGRRSQQWLKIKTHLRQEAIVGGYTEPRGSRQQLGALVLGVYDDSGALQYIGHTGGGFTEQSLSDAYDRLQKLAHSSSPFASSFKTNAPVHWVRPELMVEVNFAGWTADGHMRQPIFLGWRDDKETEGVRREQPKLLKPEPPTAQSEPSEIDKEVHVTHPEKVFWPDEGITKGDLIAYYDQMSEVLLPYLKDRPQSLNRYPHGIGGQHFFQKDIEKTPDWVKIVPIYSESNDKEIQWAVCQNKKTLLYLINLGCIELNPWHSRLQNLDRPDYCLLDLDAKTNDFESVVIVAQAARALLEEYGIPGYPKTSGQTGMHICIPLGAQYSYEQSKQFAQILMELLHTRLPELTSIERSPSKREHKIYLDYLQNRHGQTMASVYCVRPVTGATVSTPLSWDEVTPHLDPHQFTISTMRRRINQVGDLWQPVLGPGVDLRAALSHMTK
jgi:bifunctional non-homologous end joining protein LigD